MTADELDDRDLVRALKALADPKRFRMVQAIAAAGELSCGQVAQLGDVSQPTVSHHLKILQDAGILVARSEGKQHFISVDQELVEIVAGALSGRLLKAAKPARKRVRPKT